MQSRSNTLLMMMAALGMGAARQVNRIAVHERETARERRKRRDKAEARAKRKAQRQARKRSRR